MGTKYQGTAAEIQALNAYIKLTRAANSLLDRTNHHLGGFGLTTSQFGVLEALYHLGRLPQVEISRKLLLSTANMTTVLQNLEKEGLVCRERDTEDQRYIQVSITDAGRTLIEKVLPAHVAGIVAELSVLTGEEQQTLAHLCRKLGLQGR
ncbi:MAG: MarR family transcriptional regulator [Anaerolineae bacterium]|nr:MarR family transcriptional regulator [Anaerolineae bacterium]